MRVSAKLRKVLGLGLLLIVLAGLAFWFWVLPALIVSQIEAQLGGPATIGSWWLGRSSAGLARLSLRESRKPDAPIWASADRVVTDLSFLGILRGRFSPRRIMIEGVKITLRLDREGKPIVPLGARASGSGDAAALPTLVVNNAQVTVRQEGRPEFIVSRVQARLAPYHGQAQLAARSDDPEWGPVEAYGDFAPSFHSGRIELNSKQGIAVDPQKVECIPFVPREVWANVLPHGLVDVRMNLDFGTEGAIRTRIEIGLRGTTVKSTALDLTASRATGKVVVDGGLLHLEEVAGEAIEGRVHAQGSLDFTRSPPQFDLSLGLKGINVAKAPKSWQLDEAGITGRLSGSARLKVLLDPKGVDLSGSTGEAEVTGGSIQGIPVKSLKLVMHADGNDLQYETKVSGNSLLRATLGSLLAAAAAPSQTERLSQLRNLGTDILSDELIALQPPPGPEAVPTKPAKDKDRSGSVRLPRSITTQIELQDVDLAKLIARAKLLMGGPLSIPVSGKLDLKAEATIPLGTLRELKDYGFHGDLTLRGASLFLVDVGTLSARLDLAGGVLELKDLRGRLVDCPDGGPNNPPPVLPPVPVQGPLPAGAFRGHLRAELSPLGRLSARVEGNRLPLGELAAPLMPRPTPLSGLISLQASADTDLGRVSEPKAWSVSGRAKSVQVGYQGTSLDSVSLAFGLQKGRLVVSDCAAQMNGQPLRANLDVDLDPPHAFQGAIDVREWDLAALLALIPSAPPASLVAGSLTARADAQGTLLPVQVTTKGEGQFGRFRAGPVSLGDVPFRWKTAGDTIEVSAVDVRPFGGRLQAEARVPTVKGRPIEGSVTLEYLDTARLSEALSGQGLNLSGKAGGEANFVIASDVSRLEANVRLSAPDLKVQGIPTEQLQAVVRAHKGVVSYDVTADSLGGKIRFEGGVPLSAAPAGRVTEGELRAAGFSLEQVWKALGLTGGAAQLEGLGAIDVNLRAGRVGGKDGLWAHGLAEFRDLSWGKHYPLGQLRGTVALTPTTWWVEPLDGGLLGGLASGRAWGTSPAQGPRQTGFEFRIDRAALHQLLAFQPALAKHADGFGTLRVAGQLGESLHASAELDVTRARFFGLPLTELRAPAELVVTPATGTGQIQVRHWSARLAGGRLRGNVLLHLGAEPSFQGDVVLSELDVEAISRLMSDAGRPESGRITGKIGLSGHNPALPMSYRGRVDLALSDASLVSLPVLREIDKFLGASRGGLFESGELHGTIANNQLNVEQSTLQGRLAQVHATGTVSFDGQLNLEVLVNTNQIIPEAGQSLVRAIPGLGNVLNRREDASFRVANYLSNRLLKLRVSGTVRNPTAALDPTVAVADTAVAFFAGVLKLPLGFVK